MSSIKGFIINGEVVELDYEALANRPAGQNVKAGLSTDTKPTEGVITGDVFIEVDTGNVYFYSSTNSSWVEQFSFQS